jgi:sigma-B regulation protein RsbU (phosphoserine phosphatase)
MLVTMGLALVNKERQTLTYASAGHLYPYLLRNGRITQIELSSLPIGIDQEEEFPEKTVSFSEGDLLILYTDGLIEAKNERDEMYGFQRIEQVLMQSDQTVAIHRFAERVMGDVGAFAAGNQYEDDLTLLVLRMVSKRRTDGWKEEI